VIGLPTLSQLDHAAGVRLWLAIAPADMRCSFDRLAELAARVRLRIRSELDDGKYPTREIVTPEQLARVRLCPDPILVPIRKYSFAA